MKRTTLTLLLSAFFVGPSQADLVPNGEFQMYKPGTNYTVKATFGVGNNSFARGVGDNIELAGGTVSYEDGSADGETGDGIPDIDMPGWAPLQSGNDLFGNGVDGSNGMNLFAAWGGDGRIQSAESLGRIEAGNVYTISVLVGGPDGGPIQGPLAVHLAADGVQLIPSEVVDPTLPNGGAFQEISRTYDADSIAGHIGAELTIVLGVEDANDFANRVVFDNVCLEVVRTGPPPRFSLSISANGSELDFVWESQAGVYYVLQSSTDLAADPSTWTSVNVPGSVENNGVFEIATTPPRNMQTIPRPADASRFYRVQEFPLPPVAVLSDDFESGQGAWTTVSEDEPLPALISSTEWELGAPDANLFGGPSAARSGANVFGTDLDENYLEDTLIRLRSPAIDLTTATEATVTYWQWRDIEEMFDAGLVRLLDAGDLSELAVLDSGIEGSSSDWEEVTFTVPAEALGRSVILEFTFDSDEFTNQAGWYIDDVVVTTPAP